MTDVSVIIPTLNAARFLRQAIESVMAGDVLPREIVVVDGGSSDGTETIARSFPKVRWIVDLEKGYGAAINRGLGEASAARVAFLEADDLWLPRRLAAQLEYLERVPDGDICFGRVRRFLEPGFPPPPGFRMETLDRELESPLLSVALIHRRVFAQVGMFEPTYTSGADMDWIARARDAGLRFHYPAELLVRKRIHDANVSSNIELGHADLLGALRASARRKLTQSAPSP